MDKEKFAFNITPAPGVPLLDWYLGCIKAFTQELSKYEDIELIDEYNLMQIFDFSSKYFPPQFVEDNLIESINTQLELEYFKMKGYCSDLTFEKFLRNNKWIGERNIQNYLDHRIKPIDNINTKSEECK